MAYQTKCTIYKPIPIFKGEWERDPLMMELLRFNVDFVDSFKEWIATNLKGTCKIESYGQDWVIIEFELQEDYALFNLTWQ